MKRLSIGMFIVAAALLFADAVSAQQPVKLRFGSFVPLDATGSTGTIKPFVDAVNKDGQGSVEIELFGNGALGRNPAAQAQMVVDGVADFAWVLLPQQRGRFRDTEVLELPALFDTVTEATTVSTRLLAKNVFQGFDEFYVVGIVGTGPTSIHSRGTITKLEDIKGKKIRAGGALESDSITALGGVPVALTVTEIIEAMSRGSIDAVTSLPSVVFDFGFASVTNTHYFTRLGNLPMAMLMNKKKFDGLPKAAQDAIRKNSVEAVEKNFNSTNGVYDETLIQKLKDDPKRKVTFPSEAEMIRTRQMVQPVVDAWRKQSPRNEELFMAVQQELVQLRSRR